MQTLSLILKDSYSKTTSYLHERMVTDLITVMCADLPICGSA